MNFLHEVASAFWFFLPAGIANVFASLSGVVPGLRAIDFPMDFYATFRGRRLLGENKTIRGLLIGILAAMIAALFLHQTMFLGFLLGFGALLGDAVKSFFKRQRGVGAGETFLFFDQIDYILGGLLLSMFAIRLSVIEYTYIVAIYFLLHIIVNILGFLLGIRKQAI